METVPPLTSPRPLSNTLRIAFWNAERCKYLEQSISLLAHTAADVILLAEMDVGMAKMMFMAELQEPRKSQQMADVRMAARRRLKLSSWVDCLTKAVPSKDFDS